MTDHAANPPLFVLDHQGNGVVNPEFTLREFRAFVFENGWRKELAGTHGRCEAHDATRFEALPKREKA